MEQPLTPEPPNQQMSSQIYINQPIVVVPLPMVTRPYVDRSLQYTLIIWNTFVAMLGFTIGVIAAGRSINDKESYLGFAIYGFQLCIYGIIGVLGPAYENVCVLITYIVWTILEFLAGVAFICYMLVEHSGERGVRGMSTNGIFVCCVFVAMTCVAYKMVDGILARDRDLKAEGATNA